MAKTSSITFPAAGAPAASREAMLEAEVAALRAALAKSQGETSFQHVKGIAKNGKPFDGVSVSGPTWGYVGTGMARLIAENAPAVLAALSQPARDKGR